MAIVNVIDAIKVKSLRENRLRSIKISNPRLANAKWVPGFVKYVNKRLYPVGLGAALNRYDSSLTLYSSKKDEALYEMYSKDAVFVNFGSGSFHHPRWINYDYPGESDYYKKLQGVVGRDFFSIDLCQEGMILPFDDGTVSLIYCSHTLEHLESEKAIHFLKECGRVLRPDGVMRIAVPNTNSDFDFTRIISNQKGVARTAALVSARSSASHLFSPSNDLAEELILEDIVLSEYNPHNFIEIVKVKRGRLDRFNGKHPESHISNWDHDKFSSLVSKCGFGLYLPLYRGSSTQLPFKNLDVFDTTEPHISMYGEFLGIDARIID